MEFHVQAYDEVASTNELVKRAIGTGEPEGLVVRARCQTGGYGRQGRTWESPVGGLYQSLLLRPPVDAVRLPTVGLMCALAVRAALLGMSGLDGSVIQVKWPNDVVCDRGKLVGISAESLSGAVCIGIGVNVVRPASAFTVEGKNTPAFFAEIAPLAPSPHLVDEVGDAVLDEFARRYPTWKAEGFSAFESEFNACDALRGRTVQMAPVQGDPFLEGIAEGVDALGRLLVRTSDGTQRVQAGEAHILA